MKYLWGLGIALFFAAIAFLLDREEVALIPFAGLGAAYLASLAGVSGAVIFTVLSLGGRVHIITFLGIVIAVAVLLAVAWEDITVGIRGLLSQR